MTGPCYTARHLENLNNAKVKERLHRVWGKIEQSSVDKQRIIAKYKKLLTSDFLRGAKLSNGRALYDRTCGKCHVLYDSGGKIGPNITGSNRSDLQYLLQNILDPSAAIGRDYELLTYGTLDGRVLTGILVGTTDHSITLQTVNEQVIITRGDILFEDSSDLSMMPEGQLQTLTDEECRDLIAYLMTTSQVPLPAGEER
jgi:putative heme-binding domain-containing protein